MADTPRKGSDKCQRPGCGHPRNKHTTNPADGCTVIRWRTTRRAGGRRATVRQDCDCRFFVEGE